MPLKIDFGALFGFVVFLLVVTYSAGVIIFFAVLFPIWNDDFEVEDNIDHVDLRARASAGDIGATFKLAMDLAGEIDSIEAGELFQIAAEAGEAAAQNEIGNAHNLGWFGFDIDKSTACEWYDKAAQNGDAIGQYQTAGCLRDNIANNRNDERITELFYRSARAGYGPAQFSTFLRFREGVGSRRRPITGFILKTAASRNNFDVESYVSLELGGGTEQLLSQIKWNALALNDDWAAAVFVVAEKCNGRDIADIIEEGVASAMPSFPLALDNTDLNCGDPEAILNLYKISAHLGLLAAQQALQEMYSSGVLTAPDESEAAYWAQRAEQNPLR